MGAVLDGPGLSVSNFRVTKGINQQYGIMTSSKAILGFETGVFLNTGNIGSLQGPNSSSSYYYRTGVVYSDPDLKKISTYAKYDPAILEFDIVPLGDRANFVFSFGSEEYPEFVCSQFNDAFGLFISGPGLVGTQNAAFLPGSSTPIAVNNINGGSKGSSADGTACQLGNTAYFVDNGNGGGNLISQLDGFTKTLTASMGGLLPGNTYHVKLALADAADAGYDSGAAFKWLTSTKSEPVDLSLSASASKANPAYNTEVAFTWRINNASSIATSLVQVGLEWPVGLTWVSDDSGGAYNPSTGEWNADAIPANGSKSLKIQALVGASASHDITGELIYAFNEDPDSTPLNRATKPNEDDTATVTIYPTANSAPNIPATATAFVPEENTTAVITISATDANGDKLTYSLTEGVDKAKFQINPTTGGLSFITAPDFENPTDADKNNSYVVQVTASDGALTATQTVTVNVTDISENSLPYIVFGSNAPNHSVNFEENGKDRVLNYDATDADGDKEGAGLIWSLSGGADKTRFTLDPSTGSLNFTTSPDFEHPLDADKNNTYEVQVSVCDSKGGCTTQALSVAITNVDEDSVRVTTRVFFQGNFNLATKQMSDNLRKLGYLPKLQPYGTLLASFGYSNVENIPPFNYPGTETATDAMLATTGDDAPVDWVLVELRDASNPKIRVAAKAGLLQRDGDIISTPSGSPSLDFNGIADGDYYVAVRHRNHIGVMSATPLRLTNEPISLDFTDPATPTYGTDQRLTDGVTALLWGGDTNNSNSSIAVGPGSDANVILGAILIAPGNVLTNTYYRLGGYYASDLNLDGYTIFSGPNNDINILLGNVLLHPGNTSFSSNYILSGAVPAIPR